MINCISLIYLYYTWFVFEVQEIMGGNKMPKYLINKVFIELRYHDSLLFNDMKYLQEIINELSGLFNNQNFDPNNKALFLSNDDTNLKVTVFNNRLIIDQDEATSLEKFKDSSIDILRTIISKLCINSFIRVGMRTLRGIKTKNINEANTFIRRNFIKVNERDLDVLGNTFNTRVGFNTRFKDYDISLMLSPNLFQIISIKDGKVVKNIEKEMQKTSDKYDKEFKTILNSEQKSKYNTIRKMEKKEVKYCMKNKPTQ